MRPSGEGEGSIIAGTTLLGHLARFSSFTRQGEVLCTRGLAYLLHAHSAASSAFAAEIASRAGVAVSDGLSGHADEPQAIDDAARPDLEGRSDGKPVVKVEAKLGAAIDRSQFRSYAAHLQQHLEERHLDGVLVVLVPRGRVDEATREVKQTFSVEGTGPWRTKSYRRVAIVVASWNDVLDVLGHVDSERFRSELEQFTDMYFELSGAYIEPLASSEDIERWRERWEDFKKLVDGVTRELHTVTRHLKVRPEIWPLGDHERNDHFHRYVVGERLGNKESCFSIGVRDPFQGSNTPIWLRFHRVTPGFREIRQRIEASDLPWRPSDGHIWIPLDVPIGIDGDDMVKALVAQAEGIARIAYPQGPWPAP